MRGHYVIYYLRARHGLFHHAVEKATNVAMVILSRRNLMKWLESWAFIICWTQNSPIIGRMKNFKWCYWKLTHGAFLLVLSWLENKTKQMWQLDTQLLFELKTENQISSWLHPISSFNAIHFIRFHGFVMEYLCSNSPWTSPDFLVSPRSTNPTTVGQEKRHLSNDITFMGFGLRMGKGHGSNLDRGEWVRIHWFYLVLR